MWRVREPCFSSSSTAMPDPSGRFMSSTTALGRKLATAESPSAAVCVTTHRNPRSRTTSRKMAAK
jgi:hypothetical protein